MKTVAAITSAVLVVLLAGCGTAPQSPAPTFGFGDAAVAIARTVKACRAAASQTVPAGTTGVASIATCSINGSQVDFFVFTDAAAQSSAHLTTRGTEAYIAHGTGWDAVTHESGRISQQKLVVTTIVQSAGGTVVHVAG